MTSVFNPIQARADPSLHRRWVVAVALQLFLAVSVAGDVMHMSAATECDPNIAQPRAATVSSTSPCAQNEHCYWNGKSSLGGYCINNDEMSMEMHMPEALQEICYVCEIPEDHEDYDPLDKRVVTAPHELVGTYHCGELDGLGQEGKLPKDSCYIFQHMIYADDLCGCTSVVTKDHNGPLYAADTVESEAAELSIADGESEAEQWSSDELLNPMVSGSSSQVIGITLGGAVVSAVTMLMIFG